MQTDNNNKTTATFSLSLPASNVLTSDFENRINFIEKISISFHQLIYFNSPVLG